MTPTSPPPRPTSTVGEVKVTATTSTASLGARPDVAVGALRLVPAETTLDPCQRSALAGALEVPLDALQAVIEAGQGVPIGTVNRPADAGLETTVVPRPGVALPSAGVLGVASGLTLAPGAVALMVLDLGNLALTTGLGAAIVSGAMLLGSAISFALWAGRRRRHKAAAEAWQSLLTARSRAREHPVTGSAHARISALRRRLPTAGLPEPAERDLRSGLTAVERHLASLEGASPANVDVHDEMARTLRSLDELDALLAAPDHGVPALASATRDLIDVARLAATARAEGTQR